ncbi:MULTISPECIES: hypothetical protein [Paracoccaceae]|jgi:hypothetical protein|uniref:Uncharacterized protein n=1 Tax=Rhodophyticola porphyridii TaxID=1852017 RepID=A0A3L9Y355_9RHOB|nr:MULTISPECIES: hypothetical protein [Paracoccaceae]MBO6602802.1 hypothetical protein [Roseicyclus sp.]MBO6625231.1 hypothetical protein [Roseicyclus sp.]MBO6923669.1 hypothetical protein [Roseicyclus sp.]RMA43224.1 hypothetical protein D9R08_06295 [Rhodophyticola porphyridii]
MTAADIIRYARALYRAHGDRAEAEAAQRVRVETDAGNTAEAETWRRIRRSIHEMRGPRAT